MTPAPLPCTVPALPSLRLGSIALMMSLAASLAACGGGGGGGDSTAEPPAPAPPSSSGPYTISGKAVFESVPTRTNGTGLDYAASVDKPIRSATVQLLSASNTVLATTVTDDSGNYSLSLADSQAVKVRVRAEIKRTGSTRGDRDFTVLDNTSSDAIYALDSVPFTPTASITQNLRAASGWNGTAYTTPRAAAPFALLDVVYDGQAKIATVAPTVNLPSLKLFWSTNNRPVKPFNATTGAITTSFFTTSSSGRALYVLGAAGTDTDEYDTHVIAHEFGHYLQNALSRDDSVGRSHGNGDKLDMRVAFSEGWGNAWSGIALGGPIYVDTYGANQATSFSLDVSTPATGTDRGWYSETSSQYLIWTTNQTIGFGPVYAALTGLTRSPAFSSLFSFAAAAKASSPADAATITALWASQNIVTNDAFGTGETNNGGNPLNLPVYQTLVGTTGNFCPHAEADPRDDGNKLGEFIFFRFTASGSHPLSATKTSPAGTGVTDPDFTLLKSDGTTVEANSGADDVELIGPLSLPTGTHSVALSDYKLAYPKTSCFDFKVN
ncbi:MAG: hypothetical protein ABI281_00310 [Caldimonas sp.]